MKRTFSLFVGAMLVATFLPLIANGQQQQWYRGNLQDTIKRLEDDADRFQSSLDTDLDHHPMNGSYLEDQINQFVDKFEGAADRLKERFDEVLARGREIDRFVRKHHPGRQSGTDWVRVRNSLTRLAYADRIPWRW